MTAAPVSLSVAVNAYVANLADMLFQAQTPAAEELPYLVDHCWSMQKQTSRVDISKLTPDEAYAIEAMRAAAAQLAPLMMEEYSAKLEGRRAHQKLLGSDNGAHKVRKGFEGKVKEEFSKVSSGFSPSYRSQ